MKMGARTGGEGRGRWDTEMWGWTGHEQDLYVVCRFLQTHCVNCACTYIRKTQITADIWGSAHAINSA